MPSGRIETVYSDNRHFEAPNWSRDGRFFLINSGGRTKAPSFWHGWSPNGKTLAFIEDQCQNHPFGKQVKLRLLDLRDRSVRDLTPPFFGGQGTINVPSWSPDSWRVAFVTFEEAR